MKLTLIQSDAEENIICETEIDTDDYLTVLNNVLYYDTKNAQNREEIKNWVQLGEYKVEILSISGDEPTEDGFYTDTMYLEIH